MRKTIDWDFIQSEYDTGMTYADLLKKHGIHSQSFNLARKRGDFVPRSKRDAALASPIIANRSNFDWGAIQKQYDAGSSYRDIQREYGISQMTLSIAKKDGRLKTRSVREARMKLNEKGWKPTPMGPEARQALSERQSLNNSGGRCKWFEVGAQKVQGTWERDAGLKLTELGVEWRKCAGKADIIQYTLDGKIKRYTPDFYLPAYDIYLEFKGYWWGDDKRKMEVVLATTDKNIVIVEKEQYYGLLIATDLSIWIRNAKNLIKGN